jgi:two-component system CheB/CheR fusion protein
VKEHGGTVFVQAGAKFEGMPSSALESGCADACVPAEHLAAQVLAYVRHAHILRTDSLPALVTGEEANHLDQVILLLRARAGHDFTLYKKSTLHRRLERRVALHQMAGLGEYVAFLRENSQELDLLFRELLIGVTSFFRDAEVWEQLEAEVLPALVGARPQGGLLRAWCAGCSTGEEAYSLAIAFQEVLDRLRPEPRMALQVFATDLDKDAIDRARAGVYRAQELEGLSEARRRRFFQETPQGLKVVKEIRDMVIFAPQNLVMDPPFTKLDLLMCRNLLIYLEGGLQRRLMPLFHYALNPGGHLVLGSSESVGQTADLFRQLPGKTKIFRRQDAPLRGDPVLFPSAAPRSAAARGDAPPLPPTSPAQVNLQALTEGHLLRHHVPAAVLATANGDIVYFGGKTSSFLEPVVGKANLNLFAMAREGLGGALNEGFSLALRRQESVTLRGVAVGPRGAAGKVDVTVEPLSDPSAPSGLMLVVFSEAVRPPGRNRAKADPSRELTERIAALSEELQQSRDEMQAAREEMQSSQEELKSANEELQSTNEELQSTNEELTTSREEMQSMNEELQTINGELQAKVNELAHSQDDLTNLLHSTEIATLFLDDCLRVRTFTPSVLSIIKLIPGDAGRPITDLVTGLEYATLAEDSRRVLRDLIPCECVAPARDGRWFTVRILPYRAQDNRIGGVVVTFTDITRAKRLEMSLRETLSAMEVRIADQSLDLDRGRDLENALRSAQDALEDRFEAQTEELHALRARPGLRAPEP